MQPTPPEGIHPRQWAEVGPPHLLVTSAPAAPPRPNWALAIGLLLVTFFSATTLGANWILAARTDVISPLPQYPFIGSLLSPRTIVMVWTSPSLLVTGLSFSLPVLLILLCHELGHYLYCRHYRIDATLPYFLPAPIGLGTFGAFIRIRGAIPDRRQLFDVGIAGPIAGFVALLPFLVYGIAHSEPTAVQQMPAGSAAAVLLLPGTSLLTFLLTRLFHGTLPPGMVLNPHPFALAAWVGLFATSLNLLPISQLDGGHILYAVVGRRQWRLALPFWLLLIAAGYFSPVWILWAVIVWRIGMRHPPVWDETTPLGPTRTALSLLALAMLVLCFMPEPLVELFVKP
jgi:membrane-associated protease RseP (regulator of RpoE activity)